MHQSTIFIKFVSDYLLRSMTDKKDKILTAALELFANEGYNALTGEFTDMLKSGILDPTKVVRTALENALSIAALLLTTEAVVTDVPEEKTAMPQMPAGMDY